MGFCNSKSSRVSSAAHSSGEELRGHIGNCFRRNLVQKYVGLIEAAEPEKSEGGRCLQNRNPSCKYEMKRHKKTINGR